MRRRVVLALAALTLWVAGTVAGSIGPAAPTPAAAQPMLVIGKAHAGYAPQLTGDKPIFILALGSDARPGTPIDHGLSDSIHIIAINPDKERVSILGFPRDSYVPIPGHGSNKINAAMPLGGPQLTIATVEAITGIRFDYYVLTSFEGVQTAVDDIGGLTIDVPFPMFDPYSQVGLRSRRADAERPRRPGVRARPALAGLRRLRPLRGPGARAAGGAHPASQAVREGPERPVRLHRGGPAQHPDRPVDAGGAGLRVHRAADQPHARAEHGGARLDRLGRHDVDGRTCSRRTRRSTRTWPTTAS